MTDSKKTKKHPINVLNANRDTRKKRIIEKKERDKLNLMLSTALPIKDEDEENDIFVFKAPKSKQREILLFMRSINVTCAKVQEVKK